MSVRTRLGAPLQTRTVPSGLSFVEDEAGIRRLMRQSAEAISEAHLQFRSREEKFSATLIAQDEQGFTVELAPAVDGEQFEKLAATLECLVLIFSKKQFVSGVHAAFLSRAGQRVTFGPPKKMFTLQRRDGFRWALSGGYEVTAEFENPAFNPSGKMMPSRLKARILDIGKGGLAVHVEDVAWLDWLAKGAPIHRLTFVIQNQKFHLEGEVRGQATIPVGQRLKGYRVGIGFVRISAEDAEWLENYVLTQSAYSIF
jgi:c-di-GMP-binding flagellar brake protein YcgR